jgi:molybdate transport system substrate-binding protein
MRALVDGFRQSGGGRLLVAFGASGNLYRQLRQGAPFQALFSADESYIDRLAADGVIEGDGQIYALGRLALVISKRSPVSVDPNLMDVSAALDDGRLKRFAIANPVHAPYGQRAREALSNFGLWNRIKPRLVIGENVAQAAQFTVSGAAQGGLVASSLIRPMARQETIESVLIPQSSYTPLRQKAGLRAGADLSVRAFLDFVLSPPGQAVLVAHGFEPARTSAAG